MLGTASFFCIPWKKVEVSMGAAETARIQEFKDS
jgi:hypothetical protein